MLFHIEIGLRHRLTHCSPAASAQGRWKTSKLSERGPICGDHVGLEAEKKQVGLEAVGQTVGETPIP